MIHFILTDTETGETHVYPIPYGYVADDLPDMENLAMEHVHALDWPVGTEYKWGTVSISTSGANSLAGKVLWCDSLYEKSADY